MKRLILLVCATSAIATDLSPIDTESYQLPFAAPCELKSWDSYFKYPSANAGGASNLDTYSSGLQQHSLRPHSAFFEKLFATPVVEVSTPSKVEETSSFYSTTFSPVTWSISYPNSEDSSGSFYTAQRDSSNTISESHYVPFGVSTADSFAQSTTSSPLSYINPVYNSNYQTTSSPIHSLFKSTPKSVQIISNEGGIEPLSLNNSVNFSSFAHNTTTKTYTPLDPWKSSIFAKSGVNKTEGISNFASPIGETKPIIYHKLSLNRDPTPIPNYISTTTSKYPSKFAYNSDLSFGKYSTSATPLWNRSSSISTPKTYSVTYNLPKVTNLPVYKPFSTIVVQKSSPYTINSKSDSALYSSNIVSQSHSTELPALFKASSPTFSTFTLSTPPQTSSLFKSTSYPFFGSVTTPKPTTKNPSDNYKSFKFSSFTSTTPKPYSPVVSLPKSDLFIQPGSTKYSTYQKVVSTPAPVVWNALSNRFSSDSVFKTPGRVASYSDPAFAHVSVVRPLAYSTASPVAKIASTSGTYSVPTWHNIKSLQNTPASAQLAHYSDSVLSKSVYSTPTPISFSSFQSTSAPAQVSYPSVFSTTWNKNTRQGSQYTAPLSPHKSVFQTDNLKVAYNVEKAPLTKEYHTVETPLVSTWEKVDTWKVSQPHHVEAYWN